MGFRTLKLREFSSKMASIHGFLLGQSFPIFLVADQTNVILTAIDSDRATFAGDVFLVGVPKDFVTALLAFVIRLILDLFVWHIWIYVSELG